MKNQTNDLFVKIQKRRYRLNSIKRYEPFETDGSTPKRFGIYIYFSVVGSSAREYHYFQTEDERDKVLEKLDELFNVS